MKTAKPIFEEIKEHTEHATKLINKHYNQNVEWIHCDNCGMVLIDNHKPGCKAIIEETA